MSQSAGDGSWRRFKRAFERHGFFGLIAAASERVKRLASRLRPSVRAEVRERKQRAEAFDRQFGIDTAGHIHPTQLKLNSPNQVHAVSYGGSDPKDFRTAVGSLPIDYRRFVLVDFGSGKGRAILLATEFPFMRIVGVEFSEDLHRIAQENIKRFRRDTVRCDDVESVCLDVMDYPLPNEHLVCYFCNPFDGALMAQVVNRIRESLKQHPREIFIVYYNPKHAELLDGADCFSPVGANGPVRIWRSSLC